MNWYSLMGVFPAGAQYPFATAFEWEERNVNL